MLSTSRHATRPTAAGKDPLMRACGWVTVALAPFLLAYIHLPPGRTVAGTPIATSVGANCATWFLLCGAPAGPAARPAGPCRDRFFDETLANREFDILALLVVGVAVDAIAGRRRPDAPALEHRLLPLWGKETLTSSSGFPDHELNIP